MAKITEQLIVTILEKVGGGGNIETCGHCMTRLRLTLRDESLTESASLKALPGVLGVVNSEEQLQIILGPGKAQTAAEMMNRLLAQTPSDAAAGPATAATAATASDTKQKMKAKQTSAVHQFLARFATIFTPLIPGFIAAGMLLGFATLIEQTLIANAVEKNATLLHIVGYMKLFGKGLFTFLPILIG